MKILIFLCLIIGSGYASSLRGKRSFSQFSQMIRCVTGRSSSAYNGYGCWCGYVSRGTPVDESDRCCRTQDRCYQNLLSTGTCNVLTYHRVDYEYTTTNCNTDSVSVTCGAGNSCEVGLCQCDRAAAYCLGRSSYNSYYKYWYTERC